MDWSEYQEGTTATAMFKNSVKDIILFDREEGQSNQRVLNSLELSYIGLGLGEVGEIQNKLKKIIRDDKGIIREEVRKDLLKEAGDALYYLTQLVDKLGGTLEETAQDNHDKLFSRMDRGVIQGSGDNR